MDYLILNESVSYAYPCDLSMSGFVLFSAFPARSEEPGREAVYRGAGPEEMKTITWFYLVLPQCGRLFSGRVCASRTRASAGTVQDFSEKTPGCSPRKVLSFPCPGAANASPITTRHFFFLSSGSNGLVKGPQAVLHAISSLNLLRVEP